MFEKKKTTKGHNSDTEKGGAIILVHNSLSRPNTYSYKIAGRCP